MKRLGARLVIDTNVFVSGFLSRQVSPPVEITDLVLQGQVGVQYDQRILDEYQRVFRRWHTQRSSANSAAVLSSLLYFGEVIVADPLKIELPDPDDLPFIEVAVTGDADFLVTGNTAHFESARQLGVNVLTPREFVDWWETQP